MVLFCTILVLEFICCSFNVEVRLFSVKLEDPGSGTLVFNPLGCAAGCHFGVIFLPFSGKSCGLQLEDLVVPKLIIGVRLLGHHWLGVFVSVRAYVAAYSMVNVYMWNQSFSLFWLK